MTSNAIGGGDLSTVYDVAVVGSGGFLGRAAAQALEARGVRVGRFTMDAPLVVDGRLAAAAPVVVWAAGGPTPQDMTRGDAALADLAAAVAALGDAHVVLLSSGAVYGPPAVAPFREDDEPHPAHAYGELKLAQERLLGAGTVLRVANPYGPGQTGAGGQGVLAHWMRAVRAGEPITLYGDGSTARDYVYVDDVAEAIALAAERTPGGILNLGSGMGTSLATLAEVLTSVAGPGRVEVRREAARGTDAPSTWLDVARAREVLGWSARVPLADGVARMWEASA